MSFRNANSLYCRMARARKRGSDAYFSRLSATYSARNPHESLASVPSPNVLGTPEAASMSCCMSHERMRFSDPPASAASSASIR